MKRSQFKVINFKRKDDEYLILDLTRLCKVNVVTLNMDEIRVQSLQSL